MNTRIKLGLALGLGLACMVATSSTAWAVPFEVIIVKNTGAANSEDDYVDFIEDVYGADNVNITIDAFSGLTTGPDNLAALEAADLIIVSRATNSGDYDDGSEVSDWNGITTPLILHSPYLARNSRWLLLDGSQDENEPTETLDVDAPGDPIFEGVSVVAGQVDFMVSGGVSDIVTTTSAGNGTLVASETDANGSQVVIARWEAGTEYYAGSGQTPGGPRIFFGMNSPPSFFDDATPDGELMLRNALTSLLPTPTPVPEPATAALGLLALGGLGAMTRRRRA